MAVILVEQRRPQPRHADLKKEPGSCVCTKQSGQPFRFKQSARCDRLPDETIVPSSPENGNGPRHFAEIWRARLTSVAAAFRCRCLINRPSLGFILTTRPPRLDFLSLLLMIGSTEGLLTSCERDSFERSVALGSGSTTRRSPFDRHSLRRWTLLWQSAALDAAVANG